MLVLSRKAGEQICIGDNITVEVRRISGNRVAIAVSAPQDMRILRGELKEASAEFEAPADRNSADDRSRVLTFVTEPQLSAVTSV